MHISLVVIFREDISTHAYQSLAEDIASHAPSKKDTSPETVAEEMLESFLKERQIEEPTVQADLSKKYWRMYPFYSFVIPLLFL